jgi:RNA polymerase sigma factor (TIGR02999 family)
LHGELQCGQAAPGVDSITVPDITHLLSAAAARNRQAAAELLPLVYAELRKLAAARMAREHPGQTLDATGLVHEAYLRLVGPGAEPYWSGRGHFFAAAAEAMRHILVDNARRKHRPKHGGDRRRVKWDAASLVAAIPSDELLALDEALGRLERDAPKKAQLVKLRFFGGLTMPEAADAMGISLATAERYWTYARTWLYAELKDRDG